MWEGGEELCWNLSQPHILTSDHPLLLYFFYLIFILFIFLYILTIHLLSFKQIIFYKKEVEGGGELWADGFTFYIFYTFFNFYIQGEEVQRVGELWADGFTFYIFTLFFNFYI